MDLHLRFLVDIDVEQNLILVFWVLHLYDVDLSVLITLLVEIFLGQDLGSVDDVSCQAHAFHHTEFGLHIFTFRLLDAVITDGADSRTHAQVDTKVNLRTDDRVGCDAHL